MLEKELTIGNVQSEVASAENVRENEQELKSEALGIEEKTIKYLELKELLIKKLLENKEFIHRAAVCLLDPVNCFDETRITLSLDSGEEIEFRMVMMQEPDIKTLTQIYSITKVSGIQMESMFIYADSRTLPFEENISKAKINYNRTTVAEGDKPTDIYEVKDCLLAVEELQNFINNLY